MMKKIISFLKWSCIVFLGIIVVVEVTLRLTCEKKLARWHAMEYMPDSLIGYRYKPDTFFLNANVAYSNLCKTNKFGFPGDDFEEKKRKGQYRIIVIGTSDDTGFTSDGDQSYVKRLNKIFKENGYNVEVINCSTDGSDRIVRNMQLICNEIVRYQPDMVLLRNQLPLKDILRYRETYRGHIIYTANLSHIAPTKKYIDEVYTAKNYIFKLFNISYIFRYYCKVYLDFKKDKPKHKFVTFSENIFTYDKLNRIRMYVRNEVKFMPDEKIFEIHLYESDKTWNEKTVTWNNGPKNNKLITTISSGEKTMICIRTDITKYIQEKVKKHDKEVSISMFINPSKMRRIMFASREWTTDSAGIFCPVLEITGKTGNKNNQTTKAHISKVYLQPTDDGYIRGGIYSDSIHYLVDSVIQVKNGSNDHSYSRKGLVKFDISGIQSVEKAILKLYVVKIEFGNDMVQRAKEYSVQESLDSLNSLQSFLKEKDARLVLFETYKMPLDTLKHFYFNNKLNFFPLNIERKPEYSFGDADGHSTQAGHEAIANALYKVLVDHISLLNDSNDTCKK
jgi:hypothetical protein